MMTYTVTKINPNPDEFPRYIKEAVADSAVVAETVNDVTTNDLTSNDLASNDLTKPDVSKNTFFSKLSKLTELAMQWSRSNALFAYGFGSSCCYAEQATATSSVHDMARLGVQLVNESPAQADVMIVSGSCTAKTAPVLQEMYEQMQEPKWVISVGACANSGGSYDVYSVVQGIDQIIPVDVYVAGCPPRPEAIMQAILLLQDSIAHEKRPLGLVAGTQSAVYQPVMMPERERKKADRIALKNLRNMNEI